MHRCAFQERFEPVLLQVAQESERLLTENQKNKRQVACAVLYAYAVCTLCVCCVNVVCGVCTLFVASSPSSVFMCASLTISLSHYPIISLSHILFLSSPCQLAVEEMKIKDLEEQICHDRYASYTVHYTLCIMYYYTQYHTRQVRIIHCALYIIHMTLYNRHHTLCITHCTL